MCSVKKRSAVSALLALGALASWPAARPARGAALPQQAGGSGGLFATDVGGRFAADKGPDGVAAQVDGHQILTRDVQALCLRRYRAPIIDQMVQAVVLHRACQRKGITVSPAEIDARVDALRRSVAPAPLETVIAQHKSTMAQVRAALQRSIEMARLASAQVPAANKVHCRAILIRFAPPGTPATFTGTTRSEAAAHALVYAIASQTNAGEDFGRSAARYSEAEPRGVSADLGVLYPGMHGVDEAVVKAALVLNKGDISDPVRTATGFWILQAESTDRDHAPGEQPAYSAAQSRYVEEQAQFIGPQIIAGLIDAAHITFATDADCDPPAGTPLPQAAAAVDGEAIPMRDVAAECLSEDGPRVVDILAQNFVVEEECRRRHIQVPEAEIDRRMKNLRQLIAPHTVAEGLAARHMTLEELRDDFRQDMERVRLVEDRVPPVGMTHCRAIQIAFRRPGPPAAVDADVRSEPEALTLIQGIQARLRRGADFGSLAACCTEGEPKAKRGDLGILYPAMHDMDTHVLDAGLPLRSGQLTAQPVKAIDAYYLLQALSTSADHPKAEDAAYAAAQAGYREQQAQMLVPAEVRSLLRRSSVVYYIHA